MCTATYLPLSPSGFILTHSRDENAIRPAARPPRTVRIGGQDVTFPQGQDTWIALGRRFAPTGLRYWAQEPDSSPARLPKLKAGEAVATFAGGCFRAVEKLPRAMQGNLHRQTATACPFLPARPLPLICLVNP